MYNSLTTNADLIYKQYNDLYDKLFRMNLSLSKSYIDS